MFIWFWGCSLGEFVTLRLELFYDKSNGQSFLILLGFFWSRVATHLLLSFRHTWPLGHSRGTHRNKAITAPDIFSRGKLLPMELNSIILQDHCNIFAILFEHLILSTCRVVAVMVINGHLGRDNRKADQQTKAVKNTRISRINRS